MGGGKNLFPDYRFAAILPGGVIVLPGSGLAVMGKTQLRDHKGRTICVPGGSPGRRLFKRRLVVLIATI